MKTVMIWEVLSVAAFRTVICWEVCAYTFTFIYVHPGNTTSNAMTYQGNCCYDFVGRSCNEAMYDEFDADGQAKNTWHCCEEGTFLW